MLPYKILSTQFRHFNLCVAHPIPDNCVNIGDGTLGALMTFVEQLTIVLNKKSALWQTVSLSKDWTNLDTVISICKMKSFMFVMHLYSCT